MITFRPIEKGDLPLLKDWRNSDAVMPFVREYRYLNDDDQEKWYEAYLKSRRRSDFDQEILILEESSKVWGSDVPATVSLGVGGFTRIEWKNRKAELTFYMPLAATHHNCFIEKALRALLRKGFQEFGFHKITWPVYGHDPALGRYKTIFDEEAVLKEEYWYNGWQDRIYLSKLSPIDKLSNLC